MIEYFLKAQDGYELCLNIYDVKNPKAVVQIAHGMEEHQGRYKDFAEMLNKNGYAVVSADMRGHGKYAKTLGFFKKKEGYKRSIELSAEYDLYRQDYCGCAFSKAEREKQKASK